MWIKMLFRFGQGSNPPNRDDEFAESMRRMEERLLSLSDRVDALQRHGSREDDEYSEPS
jgi:hypothetical protein